MNKRLKLCQADGCMVNLQELGKPYNLKKRLCLEHMAAEVLSKAGSEGLWHFCQQCGKLEPLHRFEGKKRSCMVGLLKRRGINATTIADMQQSHVVPLTNLSTPTSCQAGSQTSGHTCQAGCQLSGSSTSQDMLVPVVPVTSCCTIHNNSSSMHMQTLPATGMHAATDAAQHAAWPPTCSVQQSTSPMLWSCQSGATMKPPATSTAAAALEGSPGPACVAGRQADLKQWCADDIPSADDDTMYAAVLSTIEEELVSAITTTAQQKLPAAREAGHLYAAVGTLPGISRCVTQGAYPTEARAALLARLDELTRQFAALQQTLVDDFAADLLAAQRMDAMQPESLPSRQQQYSSMLRSVSVQSSGLLRQG